MAERDERYRQAAWTYVVYGVVYWLGGLALATAAVSARGAWSGGGGHGSSSARCSCWSFPGSSCGSVVRPLGRVARDFAGRPRPLLVAYRAVEVARIAWRSRRADRGRSLGVEVPMQRRRVGLLPPRRSSPRSCSGVPPGAGTREHGRTRGPSRRGRALPGRRRPAGAGAGPGRGALDAGGRGAGGARADVPPRHGPAARREAGAGRGRHG